MLVKFAVSAQGVSHIEKGIPCQDAAISRLGLNNTIGIACVADGHGGNKYFRSDWGSQFAVDVAVESLADFYGTVTKEANNDDMQQKLKDLEGNIIYKWRRIILQDLQENPLTEAEKEICKNNNIPFDDLANQLFIYGTTLIAGLVSDNFWFVIQIGDGVCVILDHEANIVYPIPEDERLAFGRTTSLCDDEALERFREGFGFTPIKGITMATDGMSDSFEPDKYLEFNKKLYESFSHFPVRAEDELREFLPKLSERGSRDDVSIAGVFNISEQDRVLK